MMSTFVDVIPAQRQSGALTMREAGDGPTLWYFHDEVSVAAGALPSALAKRFHVLAPIHPGFGDAVRPDWVEKIEDLADLYIEAVRESAEHGPVTLVGSSVGAWLAAEVALAVYDRVESVVLVSPVGLAVPGSQPVDHWFMRDEERDATLFADPANKPTVPAEEFIANESMTARLGWNPRFASYRLAPRLNRLTMPTHLVWGAEDRLIPHEHRHAWSSMLPDSTESIIEGSGHYPGYERPAETAAAIDQFLNHTLRTSEGVAR